MRCYTVGLSGARYVGIRVEAGVCGWPWAILLGDLRNGGTVVPLSEDNPPKILRGYVYAAEFSPDGSLAGTERRSGEILLFRGLAPTWSLTFKGNLRPEHLVTGEGLAGKQDVLLALPAGCVVTIHTSRAHWLFVVD